MVYFKENDDEELTITDLINYMSNEGVDPYCEKQMKKKMKAHFCGQLHFINLGIIAIKI